ncbi:hypothetical protein V5O48_003287 [Marasmius crinis-equi]|uniref:Tethering factor for nuclear proteasome STS1 n=1 Tax=Marasmius crinis-equi TaxID=585013 RepID=A0ABR3FTT5_9AGAR
MAMLSPPNTLGFQPRPVKDAPGAFGFGFGLGPMSSSTWQPQPLQPQASGFNSFASTSHSSPSRTSQKRRIDPDDGLENLRYPQDERMDRSPTPERPKRAAPKRARVSPSADSIPKFDKSAKEAKCRNDSTGEDVDVGMLLASLPPQSLLPILTSLIEQQPSLKPVVLSLIPRPTLESAIQALEASAKKLRDAYPYSNNAPFAQTNPSIGFGFGFGGGFNNPPAHQAQQAGGMRDSYILSRLRPHISEFVNATTSYLPYFSLLSTQTGTSVQQSHSSLHRDKTQPTETFTFLYTLTSQIVSQPNLTQTSLVPHLLQRLSDEWTAWVDRVDVIVNQQGGMFGRETVESWERGLDELATRADPKLAASRAWSRALSSVPRQSNRHSHSTRMPSSDAPFSGSLRDNHNLPSQHPQNQHRVVSMSHSISSPFTHHPDLFGGEPSSLPQQALNDRKPTEDTSSKKEGRGRRRGRKASSTGVIFRSPEGDHDPSKPPHRTPATLSRYITHPDSRNALHDRLRELHSRRITLHKLIDYHDWYPHVRSTRSFNFLISLALANASYGTVKWLFRSMESANIVPNHRTEQLVIRWHVALGLWDRAWQDLTGIGKVNIPFGSRPTGGNPAQLTERLWLEFFKGLTRNSTRSRSRGGLGALTRRLLLLMEHRPTPSRDATHQKILHLVVRSLLRMNARDTAMLLARRYLDYLAKDPSFRRSLPESPLKLVHMFVAFGSSGRGLRKFHEARQLLLSFLYTYSFLVPTPLTLFLLLGNLRGAKRCGTVGLDCFVYFRGRWGKRIDDLMVRRRLASLAVKEGRMDIVGKIVDAGLPLSSLFTPTNAQSARPLRKPKPYKGKGREKALWYGLLVRRNRRARQIAARSTITIHGPQESELPQTS